MDTLKERQADMLVRSYLTAMEHRQPGSRAHAEHVAAIAKAIAAVLGFSEPALTQIHRAGLLHDVGKLGVRDDVLGKPGKLTADEYAEVKDHSVYGGLWLMGHPVLGEAVPAVLHHHERWNGTGYPMGLAGQDIPLTARILAVADVYDALTTARVYRGELPAHQAIAIMVEGSGTLFDPSIVAVFLRAIASVNPALIAPTA
jgi:HD-GYP domain-containing protein (c-di-GMP phosphodiesterase class II)